MSTDEPTHKYVPCPECASIQIRLIVPAEVDVARPNLSDLRLFCLDCHAVFGLEVRSIDNLTPPRYRFARSKTA